MKNIKLLKLISIFTVFASSQLFASQSQLLASPKIEDRYLNNDECNKNTLHKATHRPWLEEYEEHWKSETKPATFELYQEELRKFVVLHYTAGTNVNGTYATYNERGVSAHYTLANDGTIFHTVNEGANIAYHAGPSSFAGKTGLNYYSIGIEHSNPGFTMDGKKFSAFSDPIQFSGDDRWWYPFNTKQFQSSMQVTRTLQEKYKIPGWYVVTHADIAPSRKSDIGPMWNYKGAFEDYGVGYFPSETHKVNLSDFSALSNNDYLSFIGAFGYDAKDGNVVQAYQFHFSTANISGELVDSTKESILKHIIAVYDHTDKITGEKFDFFREKFTEWIKANPEKQNVFGEYLNIQ